jgi:protein involved in polysaccharide export with SLBB domain
MTRIARLSLCTLALVSAGCSSVGAPLAPTAEVFTRDRGPIARDEYRIQIGDRLNVKFPYHRNQNQDLPVRPDGKISLSVAGELQAAGLTPRELEDTICRESASRLRDPEVVIVVTQFGESRVYVGGEVYRPGFVTLYEGMTPLQAIMAVGGFKETAKKDSVLYVGRASDGSYEASRVDLEDVTKNGVPETVRLSGSDMVFVPATRIANANLFVKQYIRDLMPVDARAGATAPLQ